MQIVLYYIYHVNFSQKKKLPVGICMLLLKGLTFYDLAQIVSNSLKSHYFS